ncbi:claspin-like isoform X2 [Mytilus galloprovincialis]|uniref:claspin-like isoform X2 n=1 Tax=Mytilus galloprovincialis TaxID=29158 RepID=UPI003F7BDB75
MEQSIHTESDNIHADELKLEDKSDKADSGMDEDSQPFNEQGNDDDDEEEIVTRKPKNKKAIFDDDDDEDSKQSNTEERVEHIEVVPTTTLKTADQVLDAVMNDESGSEQNDDSTSDEDDHEPLLSTIKKRKKIVKTNIDSDSEEDADKKETGDSPAVMKTKSIFGNSDLFDAEEDSNSAARNSGEDTASDSNNEGGDDEGFDESAMDPKLLKKLKMGASKKATMSKKKVEQEDKLKLHSETQRLIRESRVNIPYHQPEPKRLQDFLARASNKQQQYKNLRGTRDSLKAKAVEEILTKAKLSYKKEDIAVQKDDNVILLDKPENSNDKDAVSTDRLNEGKSDGEEVLSQNQTGTAESTTSQKDDDCDSLPDITDNQTSDKMDVDDSVEQSDSAKTSTDSINNTDCHKIESESKPSSDSLCQESVENTASDKLDSENKENECSDTVDDDIKKSPTKPLNKKIAILAELSSLPKLSVGPEDIFDLEVNNVQPKNPGVNKLMDRFLAHGKKKPKHVKKDVELSVIHKEKTEANKEELKLDKFVYHVEEKEDSMSQFDAPGAKLVALKEKLQQKMKVKREEHRKQRQEIFDLDNEEGYADDGEDKVLDDDEEMTDQSDTDVEDDQFDEQFGEEEEYEGEEEDKKEENPFCDDEAEVDDDDDESAFRLHMSDSDDDGNEGDEENDDENGKDENSDDDDDIIKSKKPSSLKKKPRVLHISDDEESKQSSATNVEDSQQSADINSDHNKENNKEHKCNDSIEEEAFTPFSKHLSGLDNTQPLKKSLSLPIEESQDLYGKNSATQGNNFYIEESQMLDADGFLKFGSEKKPQQSRSDSPNFKNLIQSQEDTGDMDELLGLCSGRFGDEEKRTPSCKNLFGMNSQAAPDSTQGNMAELLGLCSGKFVSNTQATQKRSRIKRKADFDEDSNSSLHMVSDTEEEFNEREKKTFSDDEPDNEDNDTNSVHSEENIRPFQGLVSGKTGKIRKEFVDEEAELSGSEYDSDENIDLAEEDDIMEAELGDADVTATEDELRDQVGRAHLKQLIDDDKRELMRFQEMYLPDGDLHSDAGRLRRFKWSGIDDDTQQDMFYDQSDEEKEDEEGEEAKWRKDRFEREKWLQEQQMENEKGEDEDSQFLKLGKVFLKRRDSDSTLLKKPEPVPAKTGKQSTALPVPKLSSTQRRGSFLCRDKDTLAKIANMAKPTVNPSGARSSGKFTFQVISPDKDSQAMPAPAEPKVKRSTSMQPAAKKPRLERSASFSQSSIFNHL